MKRKSKFAAIGAALVAPVVFALSVSSASAGDPIPGVDVMLGKNPGGSIVKQTHTDANGTVTFRDLAPGDYVIEIDGKSLVAAMDKLTPPAPAKKSSSSSFSLGIGGFFGGGSSRSNEGRGPIGGDRNPGRIGGLAVDPNDPSGNRLNNGGNSSGGVGLGVSVPIGGSGSDSDAATLNGDLQIAQFSVRLDGGSGGFSLSQGYCRDAAGQGMSLAFKIADNESPRPQDITLEVFGGAAVGIVLGK